MAVYFWLYSPRLAGRNRRASRACGHCRLPLPCCWRLGQFGQTWKLLANPKIVVTLAFTSVLIVFNWGFYVWSIEVHRTLESSLGYYINPLMNVIAAISFWASASHGADRGPWSCG